MSEVVAAAARSVWAKSSHDFSEGATDEWMPLVQHLDDTAEVAGRLWDDWVPDAVRRVVTESVGAHDRARRLLRWLAGVHDVGKASPAFAVQYPAGAARMAAAGLTSSVHPSDPLRREARHEVVGHLCLVRWLKARHGWRPLDADRVAVVVGGHHGTAPTKQRLVEAQKRPQLIGDGLWLEVQDAFLDRQTRYLDPDDLEQPLRLTKPAQVLLTALVIAADWIASDSELFPYRRGDAAERAARAWTQLSLPAPWRPERPEVDADRLMSARFGRNTARPLQQLAVQTAGTGDPGLLIIEAPMGEGKTEAALLAAEVLAALSGAGGCFIALPTQATTDAMFGRVRAWMEKLPGGAQHSTFLAHGKASLNDDYRQIFRTRGPVSVAVDADGGVCGWVPEQAVAAVVHQWLSGRKKGVLSSFVVGTVDQTLFAALKSKHLVLRHLALAGKVVVIDEVHAYDAYMGSYLDRALHWLGAYGTPVVLLSATLPAGRRRELVTAYQQGRGMDRNADWLASTDYPLLTATDGARVEQWPCAAAPRRTDVHLEVVPPSDDELGDLADRLAEALVDGGCALVVRNTVGRAQAAGRYLAEQFGANTVTVTHARFLAGQRAAKDLDLLRRFGPPGKGVVRPSRHVVVATQVVEQSLDVDFDLLVTDLAPVDLLLQRMGRLHRHERGTNQSQRPARLRSARCLVTGIDLAGPTPTVEPGTAAVYELDALYRTVAALEETRDQPITLPDDISPLVQRVYGGADVGPAAWAEAMAAAEAAAAANRAERQRRAEVFQLGEAGGTSAILGWTDAGAGDVSDEDPRAHAHVRDGDPTLEVLVVVRGPDGLRLPGALQGHGGRLLTSTGPIDAAEARLLAASSLRLPASFTRYPRHFDGVIAELEGDYVPEWQAHPLVAGQLVLVLDEHGQRELVGRRLHYTADLGLEEIRA